MECETGETDLHHVAIFEILGNRFLLVHEEAGFGGHVEDGRVALIVHLHHRVHVAHGVLLDADIAREGRADHEAFLVYLEGFLDVFFARLHREREYHHPLDVGVGGKRGLAAG